jgi:hypothetical protein
MAGDGEIIQGQEIIKAEEFDFFVSGIFNS